MTTVQEDCAMSTEKQLLYPVCKNCFRQLLSFAAFGSFRLCGCKVARNPVN